MDSRVYGKRRGVGVEDRVGDSGCWVKGIADEISKGFVEGGGEKNKTEEIGEEGDEVGVN